MTKTNHAHQKRKSCRVCGGNKLRLFLSLGPTPLANAFLDSPDKFINEPFYPLDVFFCETCFLVQLLDVINPEILFRNYIYVTGTSDTIAEHNAQYAKTVVEILGLSPVDLVIEIASNDGSLLKCFQEYGVRILGIEPAENIAEMANAIGVETLNKFFQSKTAAEVRSSHGLAKAVIGNNVLAHVDEVRDFLSGFRDLLAEDGLAIVEVPYLRDLVDRLEYDTIYHEHLCYFSVSSLIRLCDEVNLSIVRVDHTPIHGGSLRMYAGLQKRFRGHHREVLNLAKEEQTIRLNDFSRYEKFALDVENSREKLLNLIETKKGLGKQLAAYGAPAKGNTLLNYCGIGAQLIPFTVDKNPMKVGLYTPGTHIPVLPVSTLMEREPDYVLVLAWNFAQEIMRQQREYRQRGGKFILPIPEAKVV